MRSFLTLLTLVTLLSANGLSQMSQPMVRENATRISDHVWAIDAGKQISAELKTQHPDWPDTNAAGFVKSVYGEPQ